VNKVAARLAADVFLLVIMPRNACEKCGNEIGPAIRFCRKCGHPTGQPVDATTRALGSTPAIGAPTTVLNSNATGPAYVSPDSKSVPVLPPPPVASTEPVRPNRSKLPIAIAILVVVLGGVVVCVLVFRGKSDTGGPQQTAGSYGPQSGTPSSTVGVGNSLIYPGSKAGMSVSRQNRTIAQYETSDPIGKVIDWYKYKMKVTELKITPGGQQAVLTLDKSTVTLTSAGTVTNITITQER